MIAKYLITSSEFYTQNPEIFRQRVEEQLQKHKPEFALFRDKEAQNYKELAEIFLQLCSALRETKAFLHGDYKLAAALGADGVHLTSTMFDKIAEAKALGLEVVISTHRDEELTLAEELGADYATYSPIYPSPNKGEPKGLAALEVALEKSSLRLFALGGILQEEQCQELERLGTFGFASIRYFYT